MAGPEPELLTRQLRWPLRLTLLGLWAERLSRAFWPFWTILISVLAAFSFRFQDSAPIEAIWIVLVLAGLGLVWTGVNGLRAFRRPSRTEAMARLDSALPGRPLAALTDAQAVGGDDPASRAVWAAHLARMAERARQAKPVAPNLRLAERDPFALRYVALTAFVIALAFGSVLRVTEVAALAPGAHRGVAAGPTWEGWAQPPAYTGKPALYLPDQTGDRLTMPVGTRIAVRLYGEVGDLTLAETVSARTDVPAASDPAQDFEVNQSGRVEISGPGGRVFQIVALPDKAPTVAPEGEIDRDGDGRFKQGFKAQDDYGIAGGTVTLALDLGAVDRRYGLAVEPEPLEPVVLDLPLPVTGNRADFTETLVDDLSQSLLANMPVTMSFEVSDASGRKGASEPVHVVLPGKRFFDPLAAALIEMRRDLMWNRVNADRTVDILNAIQNQPQDLIRSQRAYLTLRVLTREMQAQKVSLTPEQRDDFVKRLWDLALLIEEGSLDSARARLERAQDQLNEAIRNGASKEEIDRLMQEMREALNDYMQQLAQEAEKNPDSQLSQDMPGMQMTGNQLQQMLDELQKLMEEGKTAEAQQLMEMLQQLMQNMQVTQGQGQGQGGPGGQAMRDMQDALRDQQGLADDTFRDLQDGEDGQGEAQDGQQPGQDGQPQGSLSDRQRALGDRLDELGRGQLPGDGTEQGEAGRRQLDRAGRAMEEAERALRNGDMAGALDSQAEAMEALREGMRNFGDAMAQQQQDGEGTQGDRRAGVDPNSQRDPLGREPGDSARIGSDRNMLQGPDVYRRAQDLLDEIRRRSGEMSRPEDERDYLRRLLDLF